MYYVSSCATGRITRLLLADVSGHGSAVCDVAGNLRSLMRKFVNQIEQTRFVQSMNQQFAAMSKAGCFATAIVTTFFAPTRELSLCNAGHPPPLLYRGKKKTWSLLEHRGTATPGAANVPLGIVDLTDYDQFDVRLNVGDLVVCYTDSLIESKDENGHMLGVEGLLRIARTIDVNDAGKVAPRLLEAIAKLAPGNLGEDDVTVLLFRPNGLAPRAPLGQRMLVPFRMMRSIAQSFGKNGEPIQWPELTVRNMGGAISLALSRFGQLAASIAKRRRTGRHGVVAVDNMIGDLNFINR